MKTLAHIWLLIVFLLSIFILGFLFYYEPMFSFVMIVVIVVIVGIVGIPITGWAWENIDP